MHTVDLSLDEITKVEGSASLKVKIVDDVVKEANFAITEYKRFFTNAMVGKVPAAIPPHLARICGTCSNAHLMCAIKSCEDALGVTPTHQTKILRDLVMHGLIIRDHALHLYLFSLPDIFKIDAFLDLDEKDPYQHQLLHDGFDIKSAGNHLATTVAGRSVHAQLPVIGGFLKVPEAKQIEEVITKLKAAREGVIRLIEIFKNCDFVFDRQTKYMAQIPDGSYGYLDGSIVTSKGEHYPQEKFREHLEHVVLPYSQASAYSYQGEDYMVGALARLNLAKDKLHANTKATAREALSLFPSTNIFHNNLAQAIEILHSIDESIDLLTNSQFSQEPLIQPRQTAGTGVGVIEAPRGTLYHKVVIGQDNKVIEGEVVVPTGQNQLNIERDIVRLVQQYVDRAVEQKTDLPEEEVNFEIEKLIRAYDPCMSCASHFLKVDYQRKKKTTR